MLKRTYLLHLLRYPSLTSMLLAMPHDDTYLRAMCKALHVVRMFGVPLPGKPIARFHGIFAVTDHLHRICMRPLPLSLAR